MSRAVFGPTLLSGKSKVDHRWREYRTFALAVALLIAGVLSITFVDYLRAWQGALERALASLMFIWMEAPAIRLSVLSIRACSRSEAPEERPLAGLTGSRA